MLNMRYLSLSSFLSPHELEDLSFLIGKSNPRRKFGTWVLFIFINHWWVSFYFAKIMLENLGFEIYELI